MTIAELVVNLGVKGTEKTISGFKGVKDGLGDVKSMSLEAKAGIAALIYGMQQLMSKSAGAGNELSQFATSTGLSAETLQRWQYAARQVGVSAEEVTGSVKGVQSAVTNMLMGKNPIEGMAMVANKVGLDKNRLRDTFYVMEQLQKFAKVVPADVANPMMKSFGLSEGTINAMRRQAFNAKNFAAAPIYSDNETNKLQKVDVAWNNLGQKIQMAMGHLNAKHGLGLINDLTKLTDVALKLVDAFAKMAEKLKLVEGIGKAFTGWTQIFQGITDLANGKVSMKDISSGAGDFFKGMYETAKDSVTGVESAAAPSVKGLGGGKEVNQNINVNQNLHFQHDGKDHKRTQDSVKKAVHESYRQQAAQSQGT